MNCVSAANSGRTNRKALKKGFRPEITVLKAQPMMSALADDSSSLQRPGNRSSVLCGEVAIPAPPVLPPPPRPSKGSVSKADSYMKGKASNYTASGSAVPSIPRRPAPTVLGTSTKGGGLGKMGEKMLIAAATSHVEGKIKYTVADSSNLQDRAKKAIADGKLQEKAKKAASDVDEKMKTAMADGKMKEKLRTAAAGGSFDENTKNATGDGQAKHDVKAAGTAAKIEGKIGATLAEDNIEQNVQKAMMKGKVEDKVKVAVTAGLMGGKGKPTGPAGRLEQKVKTAVAGHIAKQIVNNASKQITDEISTAAAPLRPAPPPPGKKQDVSPPLSPTRHAPHRPVPVKHHQSLDRKAAPPRRPAVTRSATLPGRPEKPSPLRPQTLPLTTEHTVTENPRKSMRPTILTAAGALPLKLRSMGTSKDDAKSACTSPADVCHTPSVSSPADANHPAEKKCPPPVKSKPALPRKPSLDKLLPRQKSLALPVANGLDMVKALHLPGSSKPEPLPKKPERPMSSSDVPGSDSSDESSALRSKCSSQKTNEASKSATSSGPGRVNLKKSKSMVVRRRHVSPPSSPPPPPKSPLDRASSFVAPSLSNALGSNPLHKANLRRSKSNVASSESAVRHRRGSQSRSPKPKPSRPSTGPYMLKPGEELMQNDHHDEYDAAMSPMDEIASPEMAPDSFKPIKPSRPAPPVRNSSIKSPSEEVETAFMANLKAKLDVSDPHALAVKDHRASNDKEMSFATGDMIFLLRKVNRDYYFGRINNSTGLVPADAVEVFIELPDASCNDHDEDPGYTTDDLSMIDTRLPHAIGVHRYVASSDTELSISPGDLVILDYYRDDDTLCGSCNGRSGSFPASFVTIIIPPGKDRALSCDDARSTNIRGPRCHALFPFHGDVQDDLSFEKGQTIKLIEHVNEDWLKGDLHGTVGLFPRAYVEIVEDLPKTPPPENPNKAEILFHATALYDFHGAHPGELNLCAGDVVTVIRYANDDWFEGELVDRSGIFPVSFVQQLPDDELPVSNTHGGSRKTSVCDDMSPHATAQYDFDAMQDDELTFPSGATIFLRRTLESDWFEGEYCGKIGKFPAGFVNVVIPLPDFG